MEDKTLVCRNINASQIMNTDILKQLSKEFVCCSCLKIPIIPLECTKCMSILCDDCHEIIKISGRFCVTPKCPAAIQKANKFLREILSKLIIRCAFCKNKDMPYTLYNKHLAICEAYKISINKKADLIAQIKYKTDQIEKICYQLNEIKLSKTMEIITRKSKSKHPENETDLIRRKLITSNLENSGKMEMYNATINGNLEKFKELILIRKYPIFEEISAKNFFWTSLHYAMHFGQVQIIFFIFDLMLKLGKVDVALKLVSADGRCPLLCLLKSNSLEQEKKICILEQILRKYGKSITISKYVKRELKVRKMTSILKLINTNVS